MKTRFITYTQAICLDLSVPVQEVMVANSGWQGARGRWTNSNQMLPVSPVFNGAVLLTPKRFLKDIPRVSPDGFWTWAEVNENARLRFDLNYDLIESLSRTEKARLGRQLARRDVNLLERYVDDATTDAAAYDVDTDPRGLVHWEQAGREIAQASTAPMEPETQAGFEDWLTALAASFKSAVEDNGLWRVLWNEGNTQPRRESIAQVTARTTWIEHCRARNIDISREADCGRGPVDFKFTRGWQMRGLIEVKHISSSQFTHGAETQLPIYLQGESAPFGIYLCIGYADRDFVEDRLNLVRGACAAITSLGKTRIVPMFVDARPKASASKA